MSKRLGDNTKCSDFNLCRLLPIVSNKKEKACLLRPRRLIRAFDKVVLAALLLRHRLCIRDHRTVALATVTSPLGNGSR